MAVLSAAGAVCAMWLASTSPAIGAARMFLVRQGNDPNATTPGSPISVTLNAGQSVVLEIWLDDTAPDNLIGWQATMPCAGLGGVLGSLDFVAPPAINTGLATFVFQPPLTVFPAVDNGQCDPNIACMGPTCPGSSICQAGFCSVLNPRATAAILAATGPVVSTPKYLATFTYQSSANASGLFSVDIVDGVDESFLRRGPDQAAIPVTFDGADVTVRCTSNATCNDNNACTTDSCNIGTGICSNNSSVPAGQCCNPSNGSLTPISDGNDCTNDLCDAGTGVVTHPNQPNGSACGSPTSTQCDQADTCLAGVCQSNFRPNGFACGNGTPTDPQCDAADTCNGAGVCLSNNVAANTPCGSPLDDQCTDPDTCNGAGSCVNNNVANGTPCDDGLICNTGEVCANGACGGGGPLDCEDGNQCTANTCVEGVGCQSAFTTDPCDDGNPCTGTGAPGVGIDECDGAGNCVGNPDPNCNLNCSTAVAIFEGVNGGFSNSSATEPDDAEASCQPNSNNDVWFSYTATCSLEVLVSTTGSLMAPFNDTVLSVYDACGGNEIACDDDGGPGNLSALTFNAVANVTYYIRVAGFNLNSGLITVNIAPSTAEGCLIDGACYNDGDLNPANDCEYCAPQASTTSWTPLSKGTACGDPTDDECDSPDACDGAGVCELNHKENGAPCPDDGVECSFDVCNSGLCSHPPRPEGVLCGDPTDDECDNPDTCDGMGACNPRYEVAGAPCGDLSDTQCDNPDTCTGGGSCQVNHEVNGTPCDDLDICTEADACDDGACVGAPIPTAPSVMSGGPRALEVSANPPASVAPVALLLTGDPGNPRIDCISLYIQPDGSLGPAPVFQLPAAWATVIVSGSEIIPSTQSGMTFIPTTYFVQAECGAYLSPAGSSATARWGDVDNSGIVNIDDILCVLSGFGGSFVNCTLYNVDLFPCSGPDGVINIDDILVILNAFSGAPYPCADPCP